MTPGVGVEGAKGAEETRLPRPFLRRLDRFLSPYLKGVTAPQRRYYVLVPLTGVLGGLISVAFVKFLALVQEVFWGSRHDLLSGVLSSPPWVRVLVPVAGGVMVAILLAMRRRTRPPEGTSHLIESLVLRKGRIELGPTVLDGAVSIGAVGMGASLGREGALIQGGAAAGSFLGRLFRLDEYHTKVLLACGAAAGMAAAYNVPIGASVFAMEILLGSFALELFGPIVVSSIISTAISRVLLSDLPAYHVPSYTFHRWEIGPYLVLGGFLGFASVVFIRFFSGLDTLFAWFQRFEALKPVVAMAALGCAGVWLPDLFGNGYDTVNLTLGGGRETSVRFLLLLPALKMFFTALCRAGGIPGGLFTPSIFVGVLLGTGFGEGVALLLPYPTSPSGAYGLIGMGAILAGTMQAPVTAILLVFEMTGDYQVILPLMTACIASVMVSRSIQRGSLFTEPLRRKGILLPETLAPAWIRQPCVREFLVPDQETISASESFEGVMEKFLSSSLERDRLFVVDRRGAYLGAISLHEIKLFFRESQHLDPVIAVDMLDCAFPSVLADDPASVAVEILADHDAERIPVLEGAETRRFLGCITKRQLLASYRETSLARIRLEGLAAAEADRSPPPAPMPALEGAPQPGAPHESAGATVTLSDTTRG